MRWKNTGKTPHKSSDSPKNQAFDGVASLGKGGLQVGELRAGDDGVRAKSGTCFLPGCQVSHREHL